MSKKVCPCGFPMGPCWECHNNAIQEWKDGAEVEAQAADEARKLLRDERVKRSKLIGIAREFWRRVCNQRNTLKGEMAEKEELQKHARDVGILCQAAEIKLESAKAAINIYRIALGKIDHMRWASNGVSDSRNFIEACMLASKALEDTLSITIEQTPVPLVLYCPAGHQHVDEGEWATRPHKTHQCQAMVPEMLVGVTSYKRCGLEWRPADFPTVGVK